MSADQMTTDSDTIAEERLRSNREWKFAKRILFLGFACRLCLMLTLHVTEAEKDLGLTKDGFLYERVGQEIADYFRTGGMSEWPTRVNSFFDAMFEWEVGAIYYLTWDSAFVVKLINVIAGSLVGYVVWRTARLIFDDRTSRLCLIGATFFPTQVYYSALHVRDAQSTLAMSLIFLGITAITTRGKLIDLVALPIGLLLIAGFRTYMFFILAGLIPAGLAAAFLIGRSREKSRALGKAVIISALCATCIVGAGLDKIFRGDQDGEAQVESVTDLDFINKIRRKMNRGGGALYRNGEVPLIGENIYDTVVAFIVGLYFFFFSVNPTDVNSHRQLLALPEVLLVLVAIPALARGMYRALRKYLFPLFVPILIATAITFAYSGVATNGGPMLRWRLQVVNVYVMVAALGWTKHRKAAPYRQPSLSYASPARYQPA